MGLWFECIDNSGCKGLQSYMVYWLLQDVILKVLGEQIKISVGRRITGS